MVMKLEPFFKALQALNVRIKDGKKPVTAKKTRVIVTSAKGKTFTQQEAQRLAKYDQLVFLCGRYEGMDQRVIDELADEEISIGNYVMTGGELAALVMTDAVSRLRPGVLGEQESLAEESHSEVGVLEYPQYTRPAEFQLSKKKVWNIPEILLSGDHAKIAVWRQQQKKQQ
jgi:tRNA (guanine37-N1)-methyltransferase